jgi:hypothetical protein
MNKDSSGPFLPTDRNKEIRLSTIMITHPPL